MSERLFYMGTLAVSVGLVILIGAAEANGLVTADVATLLIGLVLGGGGGTAAGRATKPGAK